MAPLLKTSNPTYEDRKSYKNPVLTRDEDRRPATGREHTSGEARYCKGRSARRMDNLPSLAAV